MDVLYGCLDLTKWKFNHPSNYYNSIFIRGFSMCSLRILADYLETLEKTKISLWRKEFYNEYRAIKTVCEDLDEVFKDMWLSSHYKQREEFLRRSNGS